MLVVFKSVRSYFFNTFRYLEFFVFLACRISDENLLFLVEENAVFTSEFLVVFAYFKLLETPPPGTPGCTSQWNSSVPVFLIPGDLRKLPGF